MKKMFIFFAIFAFSIMIVKAKDAGSGVYRAVAYHTHNWGLSQTPTNPQDYTGRGDLGTDGVMFNAKQRVFIFGSTPPQAGRSITPNVQMEFDFEKFNNFMKK